MDSPAGKIIGTASTPTIPRMPAIHPMIVPVTVWFVKVYTLTVTGPTASWLWCKASNLQEQQTLT